MNYELIKYLTFYFIFYFIFVILSVPIHELGHMIFGLVTGYKFSSFRLFSFVWFKENGKLVFKRSSSRFIAGQCLMIPTDDEKKFKFLLYNFGGGFLNLIVAGIFLICMIILKEDKILNPIFLAGITANAIIGLVNLIPINSFLPNDGMNAIVALKSKEAKHGFYIMLHINDELMKGRRFKDFHDEAFKYPKSVDLDNYLVAYILMCEATRLYDLGQYDASIETYNRLNIEKLQVYYRCSILLDYLYYYIVHDKNFKKATEIYVDKKMVQFLKMGIPQVTRVLSAYEFFINNDKEKGKSLLERAKKQIESYPSEGVRLMENDYLMKLEKMMCLS